MDRRTLLKAAALAAAGVAGKPLELLAAEPRAKQVATLIKEKGHAVKGGFVYEFGRDFDEKFKGFVAKDGSRIELDLYRNDISVHIVDDDLDDMVDTGFYESDKKIMRLDRDEPKNTEKYRYFQKLNAGMQAAFLQYGK